MRKQKEEDVKKTGKWKNNKLVWKIKANVNIHPWIKTYHVGPAAIYTIEIGQQRICYLTKGLGSQDVKILLYYISRPP